MGATKNLDAVKMHLIHEIFGETSCTHWARLPLQYRYQDNHCLGMTINESVQGFVDLPNRGRSWRGSVSPASPHLDDTLQLLTTPPEEHGSFHLQSSITNIQPRPTRWR